MDDSTSTPVSAEIFHPPDPEKTERLRRPAEPQRPGLLERLWAAPDPDLVDAGQHGEWLVAGMRLLIVLLLLSVPFNRFLQVPEAESRRVVLWLAVAALSEALIVYSAVMRSWGRSWIGFFSGLVDVSLVTLALGAYVRLDRPHEATGDLVVFPLYLLAIGATALRYDWRISVLTGGTAIAQYGALLYLVSWVTRVAPVEEAGGRLGLDATTQAGRFFLLVLATALAVTVVTRARALRQLSTRDRLTQLANRGLFDESLDRLGALASRSGDPVTVAMIDVDFFKRFNDTHGHLAGDHCLRSVAQTLGATVRTTDLVARYGGEEFAAIFPGMKLEDARWRLEELRGQIQSLPVRVAPRGPVVHVTVSIGAAVWPQDGVNLKETLSIADLRLYQAKQAGRNRVVAESPKKPG